MKSSKWIWMDDSLCENTYVEFAVPLKYDTGKAEIDISVDTEYAIYINGEYVASGQYADFPWYKIYHTVDITKCLNKGENDIRIVVWYMGDLNFCHYVNRPGLRFEIKIDGQTVCKEVYFAPSAHMIGREYAVLLNARLLEREREHAVD